MLSSKRGGWIVAGVMVIGALWLVNVAANQMDGWAGHLVSHLTVAIPAAIFTPMAVNLRRRKGTLLGRGGRLGWLLLVAGLASLAISQLIEAASAVIEYPDSGVIHSASGQTSIVSFLILFISMLLLTFAAARARLLPRWGLPLIILVGFVVLLAAAGGLSPL